MIELFPGTGLEIFRESYRSLQRKLIFRNSFEEGSDMALETLRSVNPQRNNQPEVVKSNPHHIYNKC